jgi:chromosomal replication initiation ATPase DnaA
VTPAQYILDFPHRTAFGRSDFLVADSNAAALGWIDRWPSWPSGVLMLHGQAGSGKTHLVHLWRERASALIVSGEVLHAAALPCILDQSRHRIAIDDADRAPELALLHLYNSCLEGRGSVLITARLPPGSWKIALRDLRSRLRAALAVAIGAPDDTLLGAVLIKHFADRQIRVAPEVITFLIAHMDRSFGAAAEIAARLDAMALSGKCPITNALARRVLAECGDQPLLPGSDSAVT